MRRERRFPARKGAFAHQLPFQEGRFLNNFSDARRVVHARQLDDQLIVFRIAVFGDGRLGDTQTVDAPVDSRYRLLERLIADGGDRGRLQFQGVGQRPARLDARKLVRIPVRKLLIDHRPQVPALPLPIVRSTSPQMQLSKKGIP